MTSHKNILGLAALALLIALLGFLPTRVAYASTASGGEADFYGVITSLPATPDFVGDWKVNLRTVHVISTTQIITKNGSVALGAYVEVNGVPQHDGSINALKIQVLAGRGRPDLHVRFTGIVKSLPADPHNGDWIVTTQMLTKTLDVTVHISATTIIVMEDGATLAVSSTVSVEGLLLPDKTVNAGEIEVLAGPPTPHKNIEFFGRIMSLPISGTVGVWTIGTYTVNVSTTTKIDNDGKPIKVGDFAHVEGVLQMDGSVNARNIEIHHDKVAPPPINYIKFYGDVTVVPTTTKRIGDWIVNGITVHVTTTTKIDLDGPTFPALPFRAEVKGILNGDGSVDAIQIEIDSEHGMKAGNFGRATAVSHPAQ